MKSADLWVVIVSYNTRELLAACLESLVGLPSGIEVIVIDNASADGSAALVRERFPQVQLIENSQNVGYARANNQGILLSVGHYILLLNPDTEVQLGTLGRLVAFLDAHPEVGAVGLQLLNPNGTLQPSGRRFPTLASALGELLPLPGDWRRRLRGPLEGRDYSQICEVDEVSGAALCLRRDALNQVGLLDEDFFLLGEDIDLCWRLKAAGWKVVYLPDAQVVHHWGGSRSKASADRISLLSQRSYYLLFRKHRPRVEALALKVAVAILTLLKLAKRLAASVVHADWLRARRVVVLHVAELEWLWRH